MLEHGRNDQFITVAPGGIKQAPAQFFDTTGLGWQNIGDVIRQDPSGHGYFDRLLKQVFYRARNAASPYDVSHNSTSPAKTLHNPKKRNCPSRNCRIWANARRHAAGVNSGNKPSMTSTKASAVQSMSPSKVRTPEAYFLLAWAAAASPELPEPRMDLKNSEDSSITIRSLFLLKLDL